MIKIYRKMDDGGPYGPYQYMDDRSRLRRQSTRDSGIIEPAKFPDTGIGYNFSGNVPANPSYSVNSTSPNAGINWTGIGSKVGKAAGALAPYASNIINAFRKVPKPALPTMDSPITLSKVSLNADRNEVSREINANTKGAYRNLDGNTAATIALFNQGQKLNQLSKISQVERNENTQTFNQQTIMNAQIAAGNNNKQDEYNQSMVERNIAQQREQSANVANAGDKYVEIKNEQSKQQLDLEKTRVMSSLYSKSGVMNRQRLIWKKSGQPDPLGLDYKDLDEKAYGGVIKRFKPIA